MITKSISTMTTHRKTGLKETQAHCGKAELWEISNVALRDMLRLCSDLSLSPPYGLDRSISPPQSFSGAYLTYYSPPAVDVSFSVTQVISHTAK